MTGRKAAGDHMNIACEGIGFKRVKPTEVRIHPGPLPPFALSLSKGFDKLSPNGILFWVRKTSIAGP
jgi:hypothetical protein